ncbi:hypothetical protein LINGRAHAP2_LOCUS33161 [Linum grandiflorum]
MMGYQGCTIAHVKREANFVADCLAKSGHSAARDEIWFSNPPSNVQHLLAAACRHGWEEIPTRRGTLGTLSRPYY